MSARAGSGIFIIIVFAIVALVGVGSIVNLFVEGEATACVVEDKDRAKNSDGGSDARIYTENCGVLSVADNWLRGQFDAADQYAAIKVGETYNFTTIGMRIPLLSWFPNIIEATPVSEGETVAK